MATMREDFEALEKSWREAVEVVRRDPTFHVYLGVVYATVLAVGLFSLLVGCGGGSEPDEAERIGDKYGAQSVCEQFVEDQLKSPGTAEFSDEETRNVRGKVWEVAGAVDSENSFGGLVRNTYTCRVKFVQGDQWQLVRLRGLGN